MGKVDLTKWIKENPNAVFTVDNDDWHVLSDDGDTVISSQDVVMKGEGYGSGNCYGGDILQALAEIVGVKIESV